MREERQLVYGLIKPSVDAHTLGLQSVAGLLADSGYPVLLADPSVSGALNHYRHEIKRREVIQWLLDKKINRLGISYRLDEDDASEMMAYLVEDLKKQRLFSFQEGPLDLVFFAGLPAACQAIDRAHKGLVITFQGGESAFESLTRLGVPLDRIPLDLQESNAYDQARLSFGQSMIDSQAYLSWKTLDRSGYPAYGKENDSLVKRLAHNMKPNFSPLIRAHVGPYASTASRQESVQEFINWAGSLSRDSGLDILSIGSSQLTQSHFGEDWEGLPNGGGVPVNSPQEYRMIREAASPLLVRTYAGTKNIPQLASMHEETLNICWHALSFWWFNQLDGRGPYDLMTNLENQLEALTFIAQSGKPFEANVPHHFAFRGADDLTYIVSAYLAAKMAKSRGIKTFILQNMLNTPRLTWGIQDLAKSRALLALVRGLEDQDFKVLLQPRAGLDYFKPDLYQARIQLAAVTALMDDIEAGDDSSPPLLHVVSYSEASHLATPEVIKESIQITQHALQAYRQLRRRGYVDDMSQDPQVKARSEALLADAQALVSGMEARIPHLYSAQGFYELFASGFLPVPYLWGEGETFPYAMDWQSKAYRGGILLVDKETGRAMEVQERLAIAQKHLKEIRARFKG